MLLLFAGHCRLLPCTTSPDPDLSQILSDSRQHNTLNVEALADQRGCAYSRIKLHCISFKKNRTKKRGGASIPPFPEFQQLHRPSSVLISPAAHRENRELTELKTRTVPADHLLGALSIFAYGRKKKATFPRRKSPSVGKLPSFAASIEDLPPTLPLIPESVRRERVVQPLRTLDAWSNKGYMPKLQ